MPKRGRAVDRLESQAPALPEAARLSVLRSYGVLDTDPEPAFDDLVMVAARVCGTPAAGLGLVDEGRQWFKARVGVDVRETGREGSFCAEAIRTPDEIMVVPDTEKDERFANDPLLQGAPGIRFCAGAPVRAPGGAALGALCVFDVVPRRLTSEQLTALAALGRQLEELLELRRQLSELALTCAGQELGVAAPGDAADRFSVAFDHAPVGLVLSDLGGRFLQVNEAFCRLAGRDEEALVGRPITTVVGADELEAEAALGQRLMQGTLASLVREGRLHRGDGQVVPVLATTSLVRDAGGDPLFYFTQIEDISHRRQAEDALALAEHAVEAIVATDSRGAITFWNAGAEAMFGYRRHDVLGRPITIIVPPEFVDAHEEGMGRVAAGGPARLVGRTVEVEALRPGGGRFPAELSLARWDARGDTFFTAVIRDITERRRLLSELDRRANVDALTGLASRARFQDWVTAAHRRGAGAVVLLDLDHFRLVNDSLGHAVGDACLCEIGRRLCDELGPDARVARIGEDEFGIVVADGQEAAEVADRVAWSVAAPFIVEGRTINLTASLGIGLVRRDGPSDTAVREADTAMYGAKAAGRNRCQVFDERFRRRAIERLDLEAGLREALAGDELQLHYQPEIDWRTGRVAAVEALLRWERPEGGFVSPQRFIPVAEESGLIVPLGEWVLRTALADLTRWTKQLSLREPVAVSVNVSARQLHAVDLPALVADALARSGCPPGQLCLEITESTLMDDPEASRGVLAALRHDGVHVAVDDFGTGYSSLAYLRQLPADQLKIDRSFVRDLGTKPGDAIVAAIIALAHALGMRTVAEGVETTQQFQTLRALGVDLLQGYHLVRPLPADELVRLLAAPRSPESLTARLVHAD